MITVWWNGTEVPPKKDQNIEEIKNRYKTARNNMPIAAKSISSFILKMKTGLGIELIHHHMIGHSLGAHLAGLTAKQLNGTIPRITGKFSKNPL